MAEITFSGLATGIDFNEMVTQLVEAEKQQANKLAEWKSEWQEKVDIIKELNTKMSAISTNNDVVRNSDTFYSKIATSSYESVATVAVDSSAPNGNYKFEVAENSKHILAGRGWGDSDTTVIASSAGTFSFSDGNNTVITVSVDASTTLEDLRDLISAELTAQGSSAKVEITNDGSASNPFRLQLTGATGGKDHSIEILNDDTLLSFTGTSIDDPESITWTSAQSLADTVSVGSSSQYSGHTNKRLTLTVMNSGTVGTDKIELKWEDPIQNESGVITIPADYDGSSSVPIYQGIDLDFSVGNELIKNDKFSLDLFNPDVQLAQNSGLASAGKVAHTGFVDANTTAVTSADAVFSFKYAGSDQITINVPKDTTLQGLADLINKSSNNPGVRATVVNDGTGSANSYHLTITGLHTGAAYRMLASDFDYSTFTNTQFRDNAIEETNIPTNSLIKLDDYPNDDKYIQSSSNLISGLIDGVSITAKSSGITEISINNDVEAMADKVQAFIDSYNEAMGYIKDITKVVLNENDEANIDAAGKLVGNYVINAIESQMKQYVASRAVGFEDGVDDFLLMSQMGIKTGEGSLLTFDREVFVEQLSNAPESVVSFFSADKEGTTSNANIIYKGGLSQTEPGNYEYEINVDASGIIQDSAYWEVNNPAQRYTLKAALDGKTVTATNGPATGAALEAVNISGPAVVSGNLRIKEGKAQGYDRIMDELLDPTSGITKVLEKNYENIMKNIDKKIEREERRVKLVENRLKTRFANLEVSIQSQNSVMQRLQQQIATLPTSV
ncbi:MAG: flagellar filament capping protein FliD [Candidatus Cloacimonetes bacterium]|nr:flagellar filament capping protein FliD [Candidatus Cloacimonadota bacterium]